MPPRQTRRRRDKRTNVFVQESAPKGREELEDEDAIDAVAGSDGETAAVSTSRARRMRAQRASRQARVRSEVFTRSIGKELRKLGVLSGTIAVVLVVLTIVL